VSSLVTAVCVVHQIMDDAQSAGGRTAIDKRPVNGPVPVGPLGLAGDVQCDARHHGGPFQAVYAYADEDAAWWAAQLDDTIRPGRFGENLRTSGRDLCAALIGERWRIGTGADAVVVQVTKPRVPCETFKRRMGQPRWVKRFTEAGRVGVYLRVETPGVIEAGAPIAVLERPGHSVSALEAFRHDDPEAMGRLLAAADSGVLELDADLRRRATATVGRV
jgi:MOSC domain-containing protein YiiM